MESKYAYKDLSVLDFKVQKENWVYLNLSDDSKLKVKLTVSQFFKSRKRVDQRGKPLYPADVHLLLAVATYPEALRGPPSEKGLTGKVEEEVQHEIEAGQDEWNVYLLSDGAIVRLHFNIQKVVRTNFRGISGEPRYEILGKLEPRTTIPKNLITE